MKRLVIKAIRAYQALSRNVSAGPLLFSGVFGCRSWPTCSDYAVDVIEREGVVKGSMHAVARVARCNPLWPAQHYG